jgi:hypothetical protein
MAPVALSSASSLPTATGTSMVNVPAPVMVTEMFAEPVRPPESVTDALIVCVPTESADVVKLPPDPIVP